MSKLDELERLSKAVKLEITGGTVLVDAEDLERLSAFSWRMMKKGYAVTTRKDNRKPLLMHRFLMDQPKKPMRVDHINRDTRDNRKSNLRIVLPQQNSWNCKKRGMTEYQYRGLTKGRGDNIIVKFRDASKKDVQVNGFTDPIIGALIYDLCTVHRDEHTALNFNRDEILRLEDFIKTKFYPNIDALIKVARIAKYYCFAEESEFRDVSYQKLIEAIQELERKGSTDCE